MRTMYFSAKTNVLCLSSVRFPVTDFGNHPSPPPPWGYVAFKGIKERKTQRKLHHHQLWRPICAGGQRTPGTSASAPTCCREALMLPEVAAAVCTRPGTRDAAAALSPRGDGPTASIHAGWRAASGPHCACAAPAAAYPCLAEDARVSCAQKHTLSSSSQNSNWPESPGT